MTLLNTEKVVDNIKFDEKGLVPCIIQEVISNEVLMLAYMNKKSLQKTIDTGFTWFYSRSRDQLWNKGATSGNKQKVKEISYDCDGDTLLIKVEQIGAACHTGKKSCFYNKVNSKIDKESKTKQEKLMETKGNQLGIILDEVYKVIQERKINRPEKSYTTYLFNEGQDKILKKIGEETSEIIIASKNNNNDEIIYESADFLYHLLVLLNYHGIRLDELAVELENRR
jgi:phosphoribosyl-ATP pyrophosphohydrolase/phosphoribosyl-AMP cyclohydrolase